MRIFTLFFEFEKLNFFILKIPKQRARPVSYSTQIGPVHALPRRLHSDARAGRVRHQSVREILQ